jgi:hypothetical protein
MPERPPGGERRAVVRTVCVPEAQARLGGFFEGPPRWGRVLDASPYGLGLLLPTPAEPGTLLLVQLRCPGRHRPYSALARVAHAAQRPDGTYHIGCALVYPLPADVLKLLTGAPAERPAPPLDG